ncbi:MAG: hypothetical protein IH609_20900 [Dehalococcoidia bacterium]|nr:hypothetical protein [Dehalococcoidia bacterium]
MKKLLLGLLVGLASFALVACGGGDDDDADGGNGGGADSTPTSAATAKGTPTAQDLERLSTIDVPGFTRSDSRVIASAANALYTSTETTAGGANILVTVRIAGCDPFICGTLDPKDYEGAEAQTNLKSVLSTALIESTGLVWDFGPTELAPGKTGLHTYAAGYLETKEASGTSRVSANAYRAWYHDGNLHIFIEVFQRGGDSPQSLDDVKALMSTAEAEQAAKDVFAAFAAEFDD